MVIVNFISFYLCPLQLVCSKTTAYKVLITHKFKQWLQTIRFHLIGLKILLQTYRGSTFKSHSYTTTPIPLVYP